MKLNIDKFKKVSTHDTHTVLKHPDGHEIKVLHKALSPEVKKQLDCLPMANGGAVEDKALKSDQRTAGFNEARSRGSKIVSKELYMADGGNVKLQQAAKGDKESPVQKQDQQPQGPIVDQQASQSAQDSMRKAFHYDQGGTVIDPNAAQSAQASMRKAFHFADGGVAETSSQPDDPAHAMLAESIKNLSQKYINPQEDKAVSPSPEPMLPVASPEVSQPTAPAQPPQGTLPQQAQADVEQANLAETRAAQNIKGAEAEKASILGQTGENLQGMSQRYEEAGQQLHNQFQQVAQDVQSSKIDPNHWWDSKTTGGKIATAIGMLFAGAGGGVAGHPDMANNIINKFIDNDIESQKANLNNKNTLLSKYMDMYRSLPEAEQAARLTLSAGVEGLINQQAAKLGSANALNAAQMANAQRRQGILPQMEGLARGQVMGNMYNQMVPSNGGAQPGSAEQNYQNKMQDMRILNPDLGKDMENKYLPGIGAARVPVPDKLREELSTRKDLSDKLAQLENFSRENSGSLDPKIIKQGKAMAAQVQDAYRTAHQQGVFKESEKNFLGSVLNADPTVFFSKVRALPGYQEARKFNDQTVKQYYKSYGIKPFDQTQTMGGIQYRKVPGGWEKAE